VEVPPKGLVLVEYIALFPTAANLWPLGPREPFGQPQLVSARRT